MSFGTTTHRVPVFHLTPLVRSLAAAYGSWHTRTIWGVANTSQKVSGFAFGPTPGPKFYASRGA